MDHSQLDAGQCASESSVSTRGGTLEGSYIPWCLHDNWPALLHTPGHDYFYIPCFSSQEGLEVFMARTPVEYDDIVRVDNEADFLESIGEIPDLKIVLNPYCEGEDSFGCLEIPNHTRFVPN